MSELIFYTNPMSRGRVARGMLEEIGEPYETVLLDYEAGLKSPDFLAVNPMGKVPAIAHRRTIVTETAAICAYLADAFPEKGLAPPLGDTRRGPYFRWMFFAAGPIEAAMTGKAMNMLASGDQRRMAGYGSFEDVVATLDKTLANCTYVCGDDFTAADLFLGAMIGWARQFDLLPSVASLDDYAARCRSRPAYARATRLDDEAMAATNAPN